MVTRAQGLGSRLRGVAKTNLTSAAPGEGRLQGRPFMGMPPLIVRMDDFCLFLLSADHHWRGPGRRVWLLQQQASIVFKHPCCGLQRLRSTYLRICDVQAAGWRACQDSTKAPATCLATLAARPSHLQQPSQARGHRRAGGHLRLCGWLRLVLGAPGLAGAIRDPGGCCRLPRVVAVVRMHCPKAVLAAQTHHLLCLCPPAAGWGREAVVRLVNCRSCTYCNLKVASFKKA